MIKVVLTGSESTGKTELARALGERYGVPVSREFVREFAAAHGAIHFADHGAIARGQMAAEDDAILRAGRIVFLDTDLVSTVAYCRHYFGRCPAWIVEEARRRSASLYLLLLPDIPWIPDGVRDREDRREEMHDQFRRTLEEFGLRYVEVGGDRESRLAAAVAAVDRLMMSGVDDQA